MFKNWISSWQNKQQKWQLRNWMQINIDTSSLKENNVKCERIKTSLGKTSSILTYDSLAFYMRGTY